MNGYVLAIDQGTTSSRAIIFDKNRKVVGKSQQEFTQIYPQSGWVEHDPEEIWQSVLSTCQVAIENAKIQAGDVAAIGITNQRETVIVWDKATGKPVHNAIVWQDRRTATICQKLKKQGLERTFTRKTGLLLDPYFSGTKLAWVLDKVPGARKRAANGELLFGTVDCFLIWRLTGGKVHATDATNASRTLLFNIATNEWDDELLDILHIPRAMLPEVKDCAANYGAAEAELFGATIPILGVAGDQHAATIGQACFAARHVQIDLRHRLFCTAQHRQRHGPVEEPVANDHRIPAQRQDDLRARRLHFHRRCGRTMVARWTEDHRIGTGNR